MTNAYCDLATLKSGGALNMTGTAHDGRLLALLEGASRMIDGYCNRHFYVLQATRRFEGYSWSAGLQQLLVPDLARVDEVRIAGGCHDPDQPGQWRRAAYQVFPRDASPDKGWGRPYTRLAVSAPSGDVCRCSPARGGPACSRLVEVSGYWGYREVTEATGASLAAGAALGPEAASLTVAGEVSFSPGHTLALGEEQLYVTAVDGQEVKVARAVNGSTAAAHAEEAPILVYRYPGPVREACLLLASQLWGRRGGPNGGGDRDPRQGHFVPGLGREVEGLLSPYRKPVI